jgi:hypothetical protein
LPEISDGQTHELVATWFEFHPLELLVGGLLVSSTGGGKTAQLL